MTKRRFLEARARLQDARLYLILDPGVVPGGDLCQLAGAAVLGGVDLIQVRLKWQGTAERIELTRRLIQSLRGVRGLLPPGPLVIVNDDLEAALRSGAHGVHLGRGDSTLQQVRSQVGPDLIVGLSTHSLEQVQAAELAGADYAGLGAMFATRTKRGAVLVGPDALAGLPGRVRLPVFAIGGIKLENLDRVMAHGCRRVAVGSAILGAEDPEQTARDFRDRLRGTGC